MYTSHFNRFNNEKNPNILAKWVDSP